MFSRILGMAPGYRFGLKILLPFTILKLVSSSLLVVPAADDPAHDRNTAKTVAPKPRSAAFQPAVSPISNRQRPSFIRGFDETQTFAAWNLLDSAASRPALQFCVNIIISFPAS